MLKDHSSMEESKSNLAIKKQEYNDMHHLNELIKEIVTQRQKDGYENFEEISMYIRRKMTKLSFQYTIPQYIPTRCIDITTHEEKILKELGKKKPSQKSNHIQTIPNYMQDVLALSQVLAWGGIGFGKNEWYKIRLAMKKLLVESDALTLNFWGKIYGVHADYYVIQGTLRNYPMKNLNPHVESKGNEGINRYTYWVSNSVLEGWYELPDITHEQLVASREFKYHFTGNLSAKVKGFRNFPGKESHLLKCQIVRITHSSFIIPEGILRVSDAFKDELEGKVVEYEEELKMPSFEELRAPEMDRWVHEHAYIQANGRIIEAEPKNPIERLSSISKDEGHQMPSSEDPNETTEVKYWKLKVVGDTTQHTTKDDNTIVHAAIVISNTRWQGSTCVWKVRKDF